MPILYVNFSYVCFIYAEIFEKMLSGGLEVSLRICPYTPDQVYGLRVFRYRKRHLHQAETLIMTIRFVAKLYNMSS